MVISTLSLTAQDADATSYTSKGRILVGTSAGASFTGIKVKDVEDNITTFNIEIDGGYFFMDNLVAGLVSGYSHTKFGGIQ